MAITRARNRLWLFESNESSFAPVMRLWAANEPIVEVAYSDDEDVRCELTPWSSRRVTDDFSQITEKLKQLRPGTTANPKTWSAKGYEFIHKKDYENVIIILGDFTHGLFADVFCARHFFASKEEMILRGNL